MKKLYDKYKEFIVYVIWGAIAFFLYMFLFAVFTKSIGWKDTTANIIDNIICIIFTFFTNKWFVFKSKAGSFKGFVREFVSFILARLFTMLLSWLITFIGSDLLGFTSNTQHLPLINDGLVVQLIGQVVVIVTNYILSKLIVFKKKKSVNEEAA